MVRPDAFYDRPIPERHRIIFYLGHLEAFDWNLLQEGLGLKTLDASLDRLFAFGIDPVDGGLPSDQPGDWPSRPQVQDYSRRVRRGLELAMNGAPGDVLINVAIEHRLMHVETLAYMLHQLPLDRKNRLAQAEVPSAPAPESGPESVPESEMVAGMIEIPEGSATLGSVRSSGSFGWDNEFESQVVDTPAFAIDRHKISNGQFLEFVRAGGYRERAVWSEAGWNWIQGQGIEHPAFWRPQPARPAGRSTEEWLLRTMFEEISLPLHWPVYVSHAEASAYASWARKRLPTEAEWHRAAYGTPSGAERDYPWGEEAPAPQRGYFDLGRWDPVPVNAFPEGRSAFGVEGMLANGWEWTSSRFEPFSGFEPFSFYPGYSANFFDGLHYVLKGGSTRTEACMLRRSFRNWFQPHYQYVYAGFRCAV
jgi:gamma-glutamyl hercynylcysteine S-oxide synthase